MDWWTSVTSFRVFMCRRCGRRRRFYWWDDEDGGAYRCGICNGTVADD